MQQLILLRHAEAQVRASSRRDIDRALTPLGQSAAARTGAALAEAGITPQVAMVSNAVRATETWVAAQPSFPASASEIKPELYNASAGVILKLARSRAEGSVMVVGHNPGIQTLALELLRSQGASPATIARVESRFPPATAAVFSFDGDERPTLQTLIMGGAG